MRQIAGKTIAAAVLLFAAPVGAQDVSIDHTQFELPNGLRVIVHEDRSTPVVAVDVWYHVGSGYEKAGRTGFAHLFEHIMFEGSANVPEGDFDNLLEAAGAVNNGSTNPDRTNYYEIVPSNALELALWLEADRMGGLLVTMDQQKLDIQRDVVKNERRQSYENRPYGMFFETAVAAMYPEGHPYSWSTIGSMDDLSAAQLEDVKEFFRRYYAPNNAVLVLSGDVDATRARPLVERYFGWIPRGDDVAKPDLPVPAIPETEYLTLEDRVTLPQVNLMWRTDRAFSDDEVPLSVLGQVLSSGKNSRLYKRFVYDEQSAQSVSAYNRSQLLSGDFYIRLTAKPDTDLTGMEAAILEEIERIAREGPTAEELERVVNGLETDVVGALDTALGKAEQLHSGLYYTGDPDQIGQLLADYRAVTPADVQRVAREYLTGTNRIVISIVPIGRTELAARPREVS
jgi:zinc protease